MGRAPDEDQFSRGRCRNSQLTRTLIGFQIPVHLRNVWVSISLQVEVLGTLCAKSKRWMLKLYTAERHDAIDWYFHVILFITLYKVVLTFKS